MNTKTLSMARTAATKRFIRIFSVFFKISNIIPATIGTQTGASIKVSFILSSLSLYANISIPALIQSTIGCELIPRKKLRIIKQIHVIAYTFSCFMVMISPSSSVGV